MEELLYTTIAHYPELKDTYIIVVETKFYGVQHTLRSYPPLLSLPNKHKDRVYPIVINNDKNIPNSFYSLSREEQLGIFAHELAHMLDYANRTSPQIIGFCFNWLSKKFVCKLEQATDKTVIRRGLGNSLLLYREKILKKVDPHLEAYFQSIYLNPDEIRNEKDNKITYFHNQKTPSKSDTKKQGLIGGRLYSIITALSFFPAIGQMMYLVWIRKMHKKPDWYSKKIKK